ncbi:Y-family DNA polymerase [Fusibacter ferrireducens]|uniref:DNA repair protein n=1 Tax=Fusibacter ferrireducens TaxID=2785058 RepID=A0ABR9ZNU7_9FIRM|nr:DNA repair protein [Fusibacter ferrireducens]MBF4692132.1 DNA repair protein [Fusibacter ferrireducens]
MANRTYICIDLKSFYASVECVERGLDPMTTNLVVADPERSEKTICLAITPSMKALGIKNRCRVFEIPKNLDYIIASPRMQKYIDYAAEIYGIYLRYISKDDIHIYSIDEAFLDITEYLATYHMDAKELALMLMEEILHEVGVRATCGIGTNLYLAKIALDITAKHAPDFIGVLDEVTFQKKLWDHMPLTDFWRIGKGTAKTLERYGIKTMGQIAEMDEDFLYKLFGIDAELLIDHAWGREPVTIADIKAYKPKTNCLSSGQVLMKNYSFEEGRLIVREMADLLCLDLVDKGLITDSVTLYVGYANAIKAEPSRGTVKLNRATSADCLILPAVTQLYERIVALEKPVHRINISFNNVMADNDDGAAQLSFFDNAVEDEWLKRNHRVQKAVLDIKKKYGKNSILKGMNFREAATTRERNRQIGGHKSGE